MRRPAADRVYPALYLFKLLDYALGCGCGFRLRAVSHETYKNLHTSVGSNETGMKDENEEMLDEKDYCALIFNVNHE